MSLVPSLSCFVEKQGTEGSSKKTRSHSVRHYSYTRTTVSRQFLDGCRNEVSETFSHTQTDALVDHLSAIIYVILRKLGRYSKLGNTKTVFLSFGSLTLDDKTQKNTVE